MSEEDWEADFGRAITVFLNGNGIPIVTRAASGCADDSFLLCFNAHYEDIEFTLPRKDTGPVAGRRRHRYRRGRHAHLGRFRHRTRDRHRDRRCRRGRQDHGHRPRPARAPAVRLMGGGARHRPTACNSVPNSASRKPRKPPNTCMNSASARSTPRRSCRRRTARRMATTWSTRRASPTISVARTAGSRWSAGCANSACGWSWTPCRTTWTCPGPRRTATGGTCSPTVRSLNTRISSISTGVARRSSFPPSPTTVTAELPR